MPFSRPRLPPSHPTARTWARGARPLDARPGATCAHGRRARGPRARHSSRRVGSVTPLPLLGAVLACALVTLVLVPPRPAAAQTLPELTATPEEAAERFIRSVRARRWSAAAQFMDAETLGLFRDVVTMITEVQESGELLRYLTASDTAGYRTLEAPEVFARALTTLTDDMAGLSHSLSDRDDEILGHVAEGPDSAHVVYRTQMRLSGSVPEVNVMQMRRGPEGWRVLWSDELDVLETALRGATYLRRGPPAGSATPPPPSRSPGSSPPRDG